MFRPQHLANTPSLLPHTYKLVICSTWMSLKGSRLSQSGVKILGFQKRSLFLPHTLKPLCNFLYYSESLSEEAQFRIYPATSEIVCWLEFSAIAKSEAWLWSFSSLLRQVPGYFRHRTSHWAHYILAYLFCFHNIFFNELKMTDLYSGTSSLSCHRPAL